MKKKFFWLASGIAALSLMTVSACGVTSGSSDSSKDGSSGTVSVPSSDSVSDSGSGSGSASELPPVTVDASVAIDDVLINLNVGGTRQLEPYAVDGENELDGGTFTYTSADPAVASVSENGMVTALKKGDTKIVIGGTYNGKAMKSLELPVKVVEEMLLSTNVEGNMLTLYSGAGRDKENPFATSYTVTPSVTLNGAAIDDAEIELIPGNETIVRAEADTLTALKAGTTRITVKATSKSGTTASETFDLTVRKPYSALSYGSEPVLDLVRGADWAQFKIDAEAETVKINGNLVGHKIENGKLLFTSDCAVGGGLTMSIETADEIFNVQVTVATMTVNDVSDLKKFADSYQVFNDAAQTPVRPYVALTADIDMPEADKTYLQDKFNNGGGAWRGTLDGRGHTINNVSVWHGFMGQIAAEGVIKNLAVINMSHDGRATGLVSQECRGTIENCYFQGVMPHNNPDSWNVPFISVVHGSAVIRNVVLNVSGRPADGKNATQNTGDTATLNNLFVIAKGGSGKLTGKAPLDKNGGEFDSVYAFKSTAEKHKNDFDGCWTTETGTLIFKSALKYFTAETNAGKTVSTESDLLVGGSAAIKTNFTAVRFELAEAVEGVTLDNGVLTIAATVEEGVKIKLRAVGYDKILGTEYTVESAELAVKGAEIVSLPDKIVTGANRTKDVLTIDMSEKSVSEIISVTYAGEELSGYVLSDSEFSLNLKHLKTGDGTLVISAKTAAGTFCTYNKEIEKADFAIGTLKELMGLADRIRAIDSVYSLNTGKKSGGVTYKRDVSSSEYLTVVLTDDVDCRGEDFTARTGKVEFVGSFDGRGHTLYNLHGTDTLFPSLNGTSAKHTELKNVAFVNAVVTATNTPYITRGGSANTWGTGGYFTHTVNKSLIHDVYLGVTVKNCTDPSFAMFRTTVQTGKNYSLYGNIVAVVAYDGSCDFGEAGLTAAVTISQASGFINCHVVCNLTPATEAYEGCFSNAGVGDKYKNLGVHFYATVEEMAAKLTGLPVMPAVPENPIKPEVPAALVPPVAPTAPAEDASDEEKAAYQTALEAYNAAKAAYDTEKAKFDDPTDETYKAYRDALTGYETKKAAYDAVMASENDRLEKAYAYLKKHADGFSAELWTIEQRDGFKRLLFVSTVAANEEAVKNFAIQTPYEDGMVAVNTPIGMVANWATSWTVEGLAEGEYEWQNGSLVVAETAAGKTFRVAASFVDLYGETHTAEKTFTVGLEMKEERLEGIAFGKNRNEDAVVSLKAGERILSVTADGNAVDFTAENGKLMISRDGLKSYKSGKEYAVRIVAVSDSAVVAYETSLFVADFAVGTVDEWRAFETAKDANHDANHHLYVVLTADLDFGGTAYSAPRKDSDSWYSVDGRGHMISNVSVTGQHGFLGDVRGSVSERAYIRNIVFKNMVMNGGHGGLLCLDAEYCDFENLYIEGEIKTTDSTFVAGIVGRDVNWTNAQNFTFKNVVINVKFANASKFNAVVAGDKMALDNVYAISSTSNGSLGGVTVEGGKAALYQTAEAFRAAHAEILLGGAWELTDTELKLLGRTVLSFASSAPETPAESAE